MINIKDQIRLLKKLRNKRVKYQAKEDSSKHKNFIITFCKKHKFIVVGTFILLITQGIIETILVVTSRNQIIASNSKTFSSSFWQLFIILIILFIINSFFSIKQEKTVVIAFINQLRRRIFKNYLGKATEEMSLEKQADLIAKISYHLPLLSMGISNSFFGIIRWLIYLISVLIVAYLAGFNLPIILLFLIVISSVIALSAYFIVKKYIAQEVTFYSQIIKHVNLSLSEKHFSKSFNLEPTILKKFDTLVKFDSIFRVNRDLWMKMSFKIIFIILLLISALNHIFYNNIATQINLISPELKFLYIFLLVYLSRIINEALKIGLYFFPAKLGMSLTNVPVEKYLGRANLINIKDNIIFYSKKIKLFKIGKYYKNINFKFLTSGRYLFYGSNLSGKTTLAKLFSGNEAYTGKAMKVKIDNRRLDFSTYQLKFNNLYFFDPNFYSQKSLIEIITGLDREETKFLKIEDTIKIINKYPSLTRLISSDNNLTATTTPVWYNNLSAFALHALHCLVRKPALVIIDNTWLDLNYPEINEILNILSKELPESIFIIFSNKNISNLNYTEKYDMDKNFLSEK